MTFIPSALTLYSYLSRYASCIHVRIVYCFCFSPIGLTDIQRRRYVRFSRRIDILLTAENLPGPSNTLQNLVHTSTQEFYSTPTDGFKCTEKSLVTFHSLKQSVQISSTWKCFLHFMNASGHDLKMQRLLYKVSMQKAGGSMTTIVNWRIY